MVLTRVNLSTVLIGATVVICQSTEYGVSQVVAVSPVVVVVLGVVQVSGLIGGACLLCRSNLVLVVNN